MNAMATGYFILIGLFFNVVNPSVIPISSINLLKNDTLNGTNILPPDSKLDDRRLTFEDYASMADIHGFMDYLASSRPGQVSVQTICQSAEGRPIKMIKISSGKPNASAFWIDGGIHAREWVSVSSVSYIINELVENKNSLDKELANIDFYIVPLFNPDGYEYSRSSTRRRLWRKNRSTSNGTRYIGVDLNRNWDYKWGGPGSSQISYTENYEGPSPFSEIETKSVANFILNNESKFRAFVTFHSYGQKILYPWVYSGTAQLPSEDVKDLHEVGQSAAAAMKLVRGSSYEVGSGANVLYVAPGSSLDWAKGVAKIKYTYGIELDKETLFSTPNTDIKVVGQEAFAAIKAIAKKMNKGTN